MNVDNQLRLTEFFLQPSVFTSQMFILIGHRIFGLRLATTPLGRQASQDALVALPPPVRQVRRVAPPMGHLRETSKKGGKPPNESWKQTSPHPRGHWIGSAADTSFSVSSQFRSHFMRFAPGLSLRQHGRPERGCCFTVSEELRPDTLYSLVAGRYWRFARRCRIPPIPRASLSPRQTSPGSTLERVQRSPLPGGRPIRPRLPTYYAHRVSDSTPALTARSIN